MHLLSSGLGDCISWVIVLLEYERLPAWVVPCIATTNKGLLACLPIRLSEHAKGKHAQTSSYASRTARTSLLILIKF